VRGAGRFVLVNAREELRALTHETAQHCIHEASGTLGLENPRGVDRGVHSRLGRVTRILDLVSSDRQQRAHRRGNSRGSGEQRFDRGREPQVPADRAEGDGAHRGPLGRGIERAQRRIGRTAV
jgi:hypothetical protein